MARKSRNRIRNAAPPAAPPVSACSVDDQSAPPPIELEPVIANSETIESEDLLRRMADQVAELHRMIAQPQSTAALVHAVAAESKANRAQVDEEVLTELRADVDELASLLRAAEADNNDLRQQNEDLAARLAVSSVRSTVSTSESNVNEALTWEQRKELVFQQLERDDFDADAFVADLQKERVGHDLPRIDVTEAESPMEFIRGMLNNLSKLTADVRRRDDEISELKILLHQQQDSRSGNIAFGAAAIAEIVDADELVLQERERLQLLQADWEEKFRRSEIDASLERAKLSRERQQLANKTAELEEQIEHLRREVRQAEETGSPSSRRWLVKLGLAENKTI